MAPYSFDMLPTHIEYHSADPYYTYTMYRLVDVRWDVLNNIMSSYYLHKYWIFGLNGLNIYLKCNLSDAGAGGTWIQDDKTS